MVDSNHVARRKLVRTIGAGTGVLTTQAAIGQARRNNEIVTVIGTDGEPFESKKVPAKWLDHEHKAKQEHANLSKRLKQNPKVHNVSVGVRDKEVRGKKISNLIIHTTDINGVRSDIGDSKNGVDVSYKEYAGPVTLDGCTDRCGREEYDPVYGGVLLEGGSSACRVKNSDGYERLLTAAHVVLNDGARTGIVTTLSAR